jgi:hypothetical protein
MMGTLNEHRDISRVAGTRGRGEKESIDSMSVDIGLSGAKRNKTSDGRGWVRSEVGCVK